MKPNDISLPSTWDEYNRHRDRNHEQQQNATTEGDDDSSTANRRVQADPDAAEEDEDDDDSTHDSGALSPSSLNSTTDTSRSPVRPGSDPPLLSPRSRDFLSAYYERIVRHLHENRRRRISNSSSPHRGQLHRAARNWSSASLLELINAALAVTAEISNDNDDDDTSTTIEDGIDAHKPGTGGRNSGPDDNARDQQ
jgi:hypothetical protein